MSSLIHADIFFFIAAIATVALAVTFLIFMIMAIQFLAKLNRIARSVEEQVEVVRGDLIDLREAIGTRMDILGNSAFAQFVLSLLAAFMKKHAGVSGKKSKKK